MAADPLNEDVNSNLRDVASSEMQGETPTDSVDQSSADHSMDDLAAAMATVAPRKHSDPIDEVTGASTEAPVDPLTNPVPPPKPKPSQILPLNPPDPGAQPPAPPQNFGDLAIASDDQSETQEDSDSEISESSPEDAQSESTDATSGAVEAAAAAKTDAEEEEDDTPEPVAWFEPPIERSPTLVLAPVGDRVRMTLPSDPSANQDGLTWTALWQKLMHQIHNEKRFWTPEMEVELICYGRALEERQLKAIAEVLDEVQLQPVKVFCDVPETAQVAIATGYELSYVPSEGLEDDGSDGDGGGEIDGLYLDRSVRSGVEINYPGSVIVRGDINPGGAVIAGGDIIVWGRLRGIAHAGANGNYQATIRALRLEATQIRIASRAARVPADSGDAPQPEIAHVDGNTIRISSAYEYDKKVIPTQPLPKLPKS